MLFINKYIRNCKLHFTAILISSLTVFPVPALYAQRVREEPPPLKERLFFGGSFNLQLGTITNIELSPVIGLWVLPRVAVAAGPKYRFYKDPLGRTDIYGGSTYAQFVVIQDLNNIIPAGIHIGFFLHIEDELLSLQSAFWNNTQVDTERFFVNTGLAGAGISQPMGRRSSLNLMALWALNESQYGLYSNPEIRISVIF